VAAFGTLGSVINLVAIPSMTTIFTFEFMNQWHLNHSFEVICLIPYSAFLSGIKPAYLASVDEVDRLNHLKDSGFPFVELSDQLTLFFRSAHLKAKFLSATQDTPPSEQLIGEALGYPPLATRFFTEAKNNPELKAKRAYFDYAGLSFVGNFDDAVDIAVWLWQNVNYPASPVKITYQREVYRLFPERILPSLNKPAIL
jgi:hypothetical protein